MLDVYYVNYPSIIRSIAESLVIAGFPMKTNINSMTLHREIQDVESYLFFMHNFSEAWCWKYDFEDQIYLSLVDSCKEWIEEEIKKGSLDVGNSEIREIGLESYLCKYGKYLRRGKALGSVPNGTAHDCYLKGIQFNMIIKFPLLWLKEYQRYHFTDIIGSQSTMHKITEMPLEEIYGDEVDPRAIAVMKELICEYKNATNKLEKQKIWRRIINTNPDGMTMAQGITMNYLQIKSMETQRYNHKLDEWKINFIPYVTSLPFYKLLVKGELR